MVKTPVLTVVIPVYNVERFVKRAVNSVLAQPCIEDMEIIVVNDGSTDSSGEICDALAEKSDHINVIHQENKGVAAARNFAVSIAKGKYCAFLDADDWWDKDFFDEDMLAELESNEIDLYGFAYRDITSDISFCTTYHVDSKTEYYLEYKKGRFKYYPFWAFIYRIEYLKAHDLEEFLVKINEDTTFTERCFCVAKSVRWIDKNICNHWNNMTSVSRTMKWDAYFDEHFKSFECMRAWHAKYDDSYDVDSRAAIIFCLILPSLCANNSYSYVRDYVASDNRFTVIRRYPELDINESHRKILKGWLKNPKCTWFYYRTLFRVKQDLTFFVYSHAKLNHLINVILFNTMYKHDNLTKEEIDYISSLQK